MYPFERFTDRAKKVLTLAQTEAEEAGGGYIGPDHVLLALLMEGEGLAARTLAALGVEVDAVRERLARLVQEQQPDDPATTPIPTTRTKRLIELAFNASQEMGHHYVGTEHLLIGLVAEGSSPAAQVLRDLGVTSVEAVRTTVDRLLGETGAEPASADRPRHRPQPDLAVFGLMEMAGDLAAIEGTQTVEPAHVLLAMATSGGPVSAAIDQAAGRAAAALVPGVEAIREARRQRAEAVERGDPAAAAAHRTEEERIKEELRPAFVAWRERS